MVQWSRSAVLSLYKALLRLGYNGFTYTSKDFYLRTIRSEFEKYRSVTDLAERQRQLEKGHYFLQNRRGKLL